MKPTSTLPFDHGPMNSASYAQLHRSCRLLVRKTVSRWCVVLLTCLSFKDGDGDIHRRKLCSLGSPLSNASPRLSEGHLISEGWPTRNMTLDPTRELGDGMVYIRSADLTTESLLPPNHPRTLPFFTVLFAATALLHALRVRRNEGNGE